MNFADTIHNNVTGKMIKNNLARYFEPTTVKAKNTRNLSNNLIQKNKFQLKEKKIIFEYFELVLLLSF